MKTGNAGLSSRQREIFEPRGKDEFFFPPDRVLSVEAARGLRIEYRRGLTVGEAGFPDGIPIVLRREPGLGD